MAVRLISMIGGVVLGLTASQFPEYAQQYEQRLGGAVEELRLIAEKFDAAAARVGLDREQALQTYDAADNTFLAEQGRDVADTLNRYERLEAQLEALQNANIVTRVTGFARYYDPEIGASALESYNPAVPVTSEGFVYAGAGVVIGYVLVGVLGWGSSRSIRRLRNRRPRVRIERQG